VRNIALGTMLLAAPLISSCRVGPSNFYFDHLRVDPGLRLVPMGSRSLAVPTSGTYYSFFRGSFLIMIEHFLKRSGAATPEAAFHLEASLDQRLDRTVKTDVILEGAFGTVYSQKTCFYNRRPADNVGSVSVGAWTKGGGEVPSEVSDPKSDLPPLTGLSLVRIFRTGEEYVVVAANYEANGDLGSIHIGGTKEGNWVLSRDGGDFIFLGPPDARPRTYGIPVRIDAPRYRVERRLALPAVALAQELNVLNQSFGYGRIIRQDKLVDGAITSSRFLRPSVTDEEQVLAPACDARLEQQREKGQRTVD